MQRLLPAVSEAAIAVPLLVDTLNNMNPKYNSVFQVYYATTTDRYWAVPIVIPLLHSESALAISVIPVIAQTNHWYLVYETVAFD